MKRILLTTGLFFTFYFAFAANRFWVGTGATNNWNNTANWSNVSGGAGGFSVPGATDNVFFTAPGAVSCNIDIDVSVRQFGMNVGYPDTVFQNGFNVTVGVGQTQMNGGVFMGGSGNFTTPQFTIGTGRMILGSGLFTTTGGTTSFTMNTGSVFTGTTGQIKIAGNFALNDGIFTATSDSMFVQGNFTVNSSGALTPVFNHNNGTVVFNSTTSRNYNIDGASGGHLDFYNFVLAMKATSPNTLTIAANDILNVFHLASLNTGQLTGSSSNFQIVDSAGLDVGADFGGSNVPLNFIGPGTSNFRLDAPYSTRLGGNILVAKIFTPDDTVHVRSLTPGGTITDGTATNFFFVAQGYVDYPDNNRVVLNFVPTVIGAQGTFVATADSLFNTGDYENDDGIFKHNNGTYIFSGTQSRGLRFDPFTKDHFFNLVLDKPAVNNNLTLDPNDTAVVENDFVIQNGELLGTSSAFELNGNLIGGAGMSATILSLTMTGANDQFITLDPLVTGNWDGNVIIQKPNTTSVILNSPFILDAGPTQVLTFVQGIIQSSATNLLTLGDNNTATGANNSSYVFGPVQKIGSNFFEFPLGANNFYAPLRITGDVGDSSILGTASTFQAEYIKTNPDPTFPTSSHDPTIDNVSTCEYWTLTRDATGSDVYVWLGYDNTRSCGVSDPTKLLVARWDGTTWKDEGNGDLATVPLVRSLAIQTNFGLPFTLASTDKLANSLPVTLTEFSGKEKDGAVELKWTTQTEINNKFFDIERSFDGSSFVSIGKVNGAGNTTLIQHYSMLDANPGNGVNYYRLKQVDFDGKFTYSQVIAVRVTRINALLRIYPNPAISSITAEYKGFANTKVHVQLLDNFGRVVMNSIQQPGASGRFILQLNAAAKTAGTYWLRMTTEKETLEQKVVVGQQ